MADKIILAYTTLLSNGTYVRCVWVPCYVELFGNEAVGRAGKAKLHSNSVIELPYAVSEIGVHMFKWESKWDLSIHERCF